MTAVLVFAAAVALMCVIGLQLRGTKGGRVYELSLATGAWVFWLGYQAYDIATKGFQASHALPLQLSDITAAVAALTFTFTNRRLQSLAYFLGLAIGSQAVFTPDMVEGPSTFSFWAFWIYHLFVSGAGVYAVVVQGFRPTWRDLRFALLFGIGYVIIVFSIDAIFDLNYGYLGRPTPSRPSLLDFLGPWPQRVVFMVLLGTAAQVVLLLPWLFIRKAPRAKPDLHMV